jgi:RNA 2',3'-cyclic 3'-phosphodiesterase
VSAGCTFAPKAAMPETTRTFVAIAIPEPLGRELARLQEVLAPEVPGCRWTTSSPFHATLVFLGDVQNRKLNRLCNAVASSAAACESFKLSLEGVGAFPSATYPRVIWAGLTAPNLEPLLALREGIVNSLAQMMVFDAGSRFHPHVTLGRIKSRRQRACDASGVLERYRAWSCGGFTVREVVTFASTPGPSGSSYKPLGCAPLLCKKTGESP